MVKVLMLGKTARKKISALVGNCGGKAVILEILSERTMRFTGTIKAKLDAKGRVFLPASFRRLLRDDEAEFVLKRDAFQPCLTVYPRAAWDAEVADLRSRLDPWRADHRMTLRRYVADVEVFSLDASGRFLIPKRYLRMADIRQEVVFVGMDETIELWPGEGDELPFMGDVAADLENLVTHSDS